MKVVVLKEAGYDEALLGLSLSYNKPIEEMPQVAEALYRKGDEESKFLRYIDVWKYVDAPRYWWIEMAEYRIGQEALGWEWQSESTMHTLMRGVSYEDFTDKTNMYSIDCVAGAIRQGDFLKAKANLPEGFMQARVVKTNYQAIRRIIRQRCYHKLPEWQEFIDQLMEQLEHQEFLEDLQPIEL